MPSHSYGSSMILAIPRPPPPHSVTWIDTGVTLFANVGVTIPIFWLGIMLIEMFALCLGWLPVQGYTSPLKDFGEGISKIILPMLCLAFFPLCALTRLTRSCMLEIIH